MTICKSKASGVYHFNYISCYAVKYCKLIFISHLYHKPFYSLLHFVILYYSSSLVIVANEVEILHIHSWASVASLWTASAKKKRIRRKKKR